MKKAVILSVFLLFITFLINAQIGHVNVFDILKSLPERKQAMETLQKETEAKKAFIKVLEDKLQTKANAFRLKTEKLTEADFKDKVKMKIAHKEQLALQGELKKIEELKAEAVQFLQKKELDLTKPIEAKVMVSISKIAKAKGLTYVLDSSQQGVLLYVDKSSSNDLTPKVKADLGIK